MTNWRTASPICRPTPGRTQPTNVHTSLATRGVPEPGIETSRVDVGEATCTALVRELAAAFLVTDDYRALPELQSLIERQVVISPFVLSALVDRAVLDRDEARSRVETLAAERDWLGAPIYRRATQLFDE